MKFTLPRLPSFLTKCSCFLLLFSLHSYSFELVNLAQQAINLSKLPKTLSAQEKIAYWNEHIEKASPLFFKSIYNDNKNDMILAVFKLYQSLPAEKIRKAYSLYDLEATRAFKKYKAKAPDYNDNIQVVLAPGVTWGGSYIRENERDYLALGVDLYLERPEIIATKLVILMDHEIFHHYHAQLRKDHLESQYYLTKGKLFWQLWDEGMATWGSGFIANKQNYNYVMLQNYQHYIPCKSDARLAKQFLAEINNPAIGLKQPMNVKKWFGSASPSPLGQDIPGAFGYYLGWRVINKISQTISRKTFMAWNYQQAKPYIEQQLKIISKSQTCQ